MRITVTGALGYIGSRLIRDLPARFPTADLQLIDSHASERAASCRDLPNTHRYEILPLDIMHAELRPIIRKADVVIHLATPENDDEELELRGVERVALACADLGLPLLYCSSCTPGGPNDELVDDAPAAKRRAELACVECARTLKLHFSAIRLGAVVGLAPGMTFERGLNKLFWQAAIGEVISIARASYSQKTPVLEISDATAAICWAVERERFDRTTYNVFTANVSVEGLFSRCVSSSRTSFSNSSTLVIWIFQVRFPEKKSRQPVFASGVTCFKRCTKRCYRSQVCGKAG